MTRPLLSICIPTWNRANYLSQLLDNLIVAIGDDSDIEIVVSDNASDDHTPEVVRQFASIYSYIRYFVNDTNIGGPPNIELVTQRASGVYVWLLGDDDKVTFESVSKVKAAIQEVPQAGLIVLNSVSVNATGSRTGPPALRFSENVLLSDHNTVLANIGYKLGFMSVLVARRELWLNIDPSPFLMGAWPHLWRALSLAAQKSVYVLADICVEGGYVDDIPADRWKVNFIELEKLIISSKSLGYNVFSRSATLYQIRFWLIKAILYFKLIGDDRIKREITLLIDHHKRNLLFWFAIFPCFFVPRFALRILYRVRKSLRK